VRSMWDCISKGIIHWSYHDGMRCIINSRTAVARGSGIRSTLAYAPVLADSVGVHAQPCRPLLAMVWSATNEIVRMIRQHANRRASLWYVLATVY
jgi:hypothetical protein